jgi:hypothetical protein
LAHAITPKKQRWIGLKTLISTLVLLFHGSLPKAHLTSASDSHHVFSEQAVMDAVVSHGRSLELQ